MAGDITDGRGVVVATILSLCSYDDRYLHETLRTLLSTGLRKFSLLLSLLSFIYYILYFQFHFNRNSFSVHTPSPVDFKFHSIDEDILTRQLSAFHVIAADINSKINIYRTHVRNIETNEFYY